jgi:hypothetical protein
MLDIMNSNVKEQKISPQSVVIDEPNESRWETPVNHAKFSNEFESTRRMEYPSNYSTVREDNEYSQCYAVRLYQELVEEPLRERRSD